jgi:dienelactone hydrolase
MAVIDGEGRVQILYGRYPLPAAPHRPVYMSRPDLIGRHPATVVLHGDSGATPSVRDLCRRLARYGYAASAPDLFRGAEPGDLSTVPVQRAVGDGVEVADAFLNAWAAFAAPARPAVVALGSSAAIGAGIASRVGGPLVVVGGPVTGIAGEFASVRGPILGLIAGAENGSAAVRDIHDRIGRGEWVVFPRAGLRFYDDGTDDFDQGMFVDASERLIAFLDKHLSPVAA